MFKVNNIVNSEHLSNLFLVFVLLALNKYMLAWILHKLRQDKRFCILVVKTVFSNSNSFPVMKL